ncbi:ATPase AAA family [Butyrivibrio proteoclasticus B316]|uniref:ATPase AAA family n=1 Tax=Butyrivibrio proteoclasticus (strain ATCC 51982 / DSM 14932 / B316) TaxID=515622 RepID=E0S2R1_BUTPB|nr:ATP-binding protein [Butyrivibrio proteoclasticus]ADL35693.1 ATPase AAA family [Butyrivibrio proteoclasticus B316]
MERIVSKLLMYGDMPEDSILMQLAYVCRDLHSGSYSKEDLTTRVYKQIKRILVLGTACAFDKNLWHNYLTYLLIMDENPFSLTCEKVGSKDGSVNHFAKNDFAAFRELFDYDFSELENALNVDCFTCITNYKAIDKPELMYNGNVSEKVRNLSAALEKTDSEESFFQEITSFYKNIGVGAFGLNKAFRIHEIADSKVEFNPINNMDAVVLDDLIGYELQKKKLIANTRAFVEGKKANNVLLFGDSGTGKSTSIKAIVNEFYGDGLRMIEIYKHQFRLLSQLIAQIKNRNYKFIIYMDDLSFEEDESDYKFLKAVIEGGVETKPDNILIYATSNRRHLIKETWKDRRDVEQDGDIHRSDTMEEKLSLANRFGVTIGYYKPSRQEYYDIVLELAQKEGLTLDKEELMKEADRWELNHGGISGRTARQFVNHLLGEQ